jgi:hypothetical protein
VNFLDSDPIPKGLNTDIRGQFQPHLCWETFALFGLMADLLHLTLGWALADMAWVCGQGWEAEPQTHTNPTTGLEGTRLVKMLSHLL